MNPTNDNIRGKKILIIDDETDTRTYLDALLTENGYRTKQASGGEDALRVMRDFTPDLITLDIIMPHKTGLKFYRELCLDKKYRHIPVVILSGVTRYKELFTKDYAALPRPFAFIEKPIEKENFLSVLKSALER